MNENLNVGRNSLPHPHPDDRTIQQKFHDSQITVMILREEVMKDKKYIEESKKLLIEYTADFERGSINASKFNTAFIKLLLEHTKFNNSQK